MSRILSILFLSTLLFGCIFHKKQKISKDLICEKYAQVDSLLIEINYRELNSCLDNEPRHYIFISKRSDKTMYSIKRAKNEEKGELQCCILNDLIVFEQKVKASIPCGGYGGGHGMLVEIKIHGETREYGYCRDKWNGIEELLDSIQAKRKL